MPIINSFSGSSSPFYFGNNNLAAEPDLDEVDVEQNAVVDQAAGLETAPPTNTSAEVDSEIDESNEVKTEVKQEKNSTEFINEIK